MPALAWAGGHGIRAVNRAFEQATGWTASRVVGRPLRELLAPRDRSATMREVRRAEDRGAPAALEVRIRTSEGGTRWFRWSLDRVRGTAGSRGPVTVAQGLDVTDLKLAGEALRRSERHLARAVEVSGDGFGEFEASTGCVTITPRYCEIHGLPAGTTRISVGEVMALVDRAYVPTILADMAAIESGERDAHAWEYRIRRPDGTARWIQSRGRVVGRDRRGRPVRISGALTDITERKEAEDELRRLVAELRSSLERVKTFPGEVTFCSGCRKVGDARARWEEVETFVERHVGSRVAHGICPDCASRLFPTRRPRGA